MKRSEKKLKRRMSKYISEMIEEIKDNSYDYFYCARYVPFIALAEELKLTDPLKKLDSFLSSSIESPYKKVLDLLRGCNYEDIPEKGTELMLRIYKIQKEVCNKT